MTQEPLLLDGRAVARRWHDQLLPLSRQFQERRGRAPGLAVVRVGHDPSSVLYVQKKGGQATSLGIHFEEHVIPVLKDPSTLRRTLHQLNEASHVDGVILQLPLQVENVAAFMKEVAPLSLIAPEKDVDGLHPLNRGLLYADGEPGFVPCTPLGCLKLLEAYDLSVAGREVVVMGRSILVGRPLAAALLRKNATVTLIHSQTAHPERIAKRADFLFVSIGCIGFVGREFIKQGAVVVDVGIHTTSEGLRGDVEREALLKARPKAFSPVPGGVGPLTVMGLMHNTLKAAYQQCAFPFPLS